MKIPLSARTAWIMPAIAAVILIAATSGLAQQPQPVEPSVTAWEYASVTQTMRRGLSWGMSGNSFDRKSTSKATICYFTIDGCRSEAVEIESRNQEPLDAAAKAAWILGAEGWELTSATEAWDGEGGNYGLRRLYFRRPLN